MNSKLTCIDMGVACYGEALDAQEQLVRRVMNQRSDDGYLLLVEHAPPVITFGRNAEAAEKNVLASSAQLGRMGVEVHRTRRGGDVTWHGPGQLVGYPVIRLDLPGRSVRTHMRNMEEAIIALLERLGAAGRRIEGLTGVWVGGGDKHSTQRTWSSQRTARPVLNGQGGEEEAEKVAAIGVAVRRWVSYHGFALNVCCDLSQFDSIVPCGLAGRRVTSLQKLIGRDIAVEEVKQPLIECLAEAMGFGCVEAADFESDSSSISTE